MSKRSASTHASTTDLARDPAAGLAERIRRNRLERRDVLWLLAGATLAPTLAATSGCATSPVTGERILVGMTEQDEKAIDSQQAPHQFSQDLGAVQDTALNDYIGRIGTTLDDRTHRLDMPYSYRVLNANYVNAYTFPGGSVGVTRGIMTEMRSEAELAALLGHELGHVNARHSAQRQGQAMVGQAALVGLNVAVATSESAARWGGLVNIAGQVGASALLASYSRENEREADALGQEYMTRAGYPASGMVGLHELLVSKHEGTPSLLDTMFASHPMAQERVETARRLAASRHAGSNGANPNRERYMDSTARLRALKPVIESCQRGEALAAQKAFPRAEGEFGKALARAPQDYAANVLMSQCLIAQQRHADAKNFADKARAIYPTEAQGHKLAGVARLALRDPASAYAAFDAFDRLLPGDPGVGFLKGVALEGTGDKRGAARQYLAFAQSVPPGETRNYAISRLQAWGVVRQTK